MPASLLQPPGWWPLKISRFGGLKASRVSDLNQSIEFFRICLGEFTQVQFCSHALPLTLSQGGLEVQVTKGLISVVDDDASVRSATVDLLTSSGFVCEAFESAEAYLQSESSHLTSCLILDVRMQGLNGLELQRVLMDQGRSARSSLLPPFPTSECVGKRLVAERSATCQSPTTTRNCLAAFG